jgi:hypothetical protein
VSQTKYISGDTQELLRRSKIILGESPILDLENWKIATNDGDNNHDDNHDDNHDNNHDDHDDHDNNHDDNHDDHDDNHDDNHDDHDGGTFPTSLCSHIILKNKITIIDTGIVTCTGTATATCITTCPIGGIITPDIYVNMMAVVNLVGVAQTGVIIQFSYLINNVPISDPLLTNVTVNLIPGNNTIYLFPTNHIYSPSTIITLYGASIASQ